MTGSPAEEAALLTILGSGTLVPSAERSSASHHLRVGQLSVLFDCGPGTLHGFARHGVAWQDLTHVALTHFHNDHVSDLVALLVAFRHGAEPVRAEPLTLIGPTGLRRHFEALVDLHGDWLRDPGFSVEIVELEPRGAVKQDVWGLDLTWYPTGHTERSLSYRVRGPWGSLAYTGDTGPNPDLADFASGATVLISECNHADPPKNDHHLSPRGVAAMASVARPELLIVTHVAPPQRPEDAARAIAEVYDGRCVAGSDGLRARILAGDVTVDLPGSHL